MFLKKSFAETSVTFLQAYSFDGVDLDWEFPKAVDKDNYIQFIQVCCHCVLKTLAYSVL